MALSQSQALQRVHDATIGPQESEHEVFKFSVCVPLVQLK